MSFEPSSCSQEARPVPARGLAASPCSCICALVKGRCSPSLANLAIVVFF